jgi:hypothetical protein
MRWHKRVSPGPPWSPCTRSSCSPRSGPVRFSLSLAAPTNPCPGDPTLILPFLTEIGKDRRSSLSAPGLDSAAAALHLAVRCASRSCLLSTLCLRTSHSPPAQTVALFLSNRAISVNGVHPPGSGTTPLHIAASLARVDIVKLLLEQDDIDDTLRDDQGKTCRDVAKSRDVVRAIDGGFFSPAPCLDFAS